MPCGASFRATESRQCEGHVCLNNEILAKGKRLFSNESDVAKLGLEEEVAAASCF